MTSLAFILNPLDHNSSGSTSAKRPLPALAAAIAPMSSVLALPGWANPAAAHSFLPTLSTIAAHRLALDATASHFAAHKKPRLQSIAAKHSEHNDGARSPTTSSEDDLSSCEGDHDHDEDASPQSSSTKKTRLCKERDCTSLAVSRRSCVRHGGGSRCTFDGCTNGAKLRNRCFQHGGSTVCLAAGCGSKAKRYGYCWSHGGGRICSTDGCVKVAAQGGSCWAHGGGNRCKLDGCSKRSYQKHGYFCKAHAAHSI